MYRDKKHGVPRVLVAIVGILKQSIMIASIFPSMI